MTENEAIEVLKDWNKDLSAFEDEAEGIECHNIAVSALEEIQEYRALGTVEELKEAMEKQRAKKPKTILRHRGGFEMEHCPNCDTDYQVNRRYTINDDYCPACGKLLDGSFRNFCGNCGQAIGIKRSDEE